MRVKSKRKNNIILSAAAISTVTFSASFSHKSKKTKKTRYLEFLNLNDLKL